MLQPRCLMLLLLLPLVAKGGARVQAARHRLPSVFGLGAAAAPARRAAGGLAAAAAAAAAAALGPGRRKHGAKAGGAEEVVCRGAAGRARQGVCLEGRLF